MSRKILMRSSVWSFIGLLLFSSSPKAMDVENDKNQGHGISIHQRVPTGSVMPFAGDKAPDGWLMCDGEHYSSRKHPELYKTIHTRYVTNDKKWIFEANKSVDEKFFCVPDMRGRIPVGVDMMANRVTSNNKLGESGGEEKHKLTISEMPEHNHKIPNAHECWGKKTNSNTTYAVEYVQDSNGMFNETITYYSGDGKHHNNMQPYLVLNYIIKY